jgi:hypothetical protein
MEATFEGGQGLERAVVPWMDVVPLPPGTYPLAVNNDNNNNNNNNLLETTYRFEAH